MTEYVRQMEQDDLMEKQSTINEVDALRSVFYKLFQTNKADENDFDDKTLLRVNVTESAFNPFFDEDEEIEVEASKVFGTDNRFEHLK